METKILIFWCSSKGLCLDAKISLTISYYSQPDVVIVAAKYDKQNTYKTLPIYCVFLPNVNSFLFPFIRLEYYYQPLLSKNNHTRVS